MKNILAEHPRYRAVIGFQAVVAFFFFFPSGVSWPQENKNPVAAKAIKDVVLTTKAEAVQVEIKGDGSFVTHSVSRLSDPPRLVLYFPGMVNAFKQSNISVGHALLNRIRIVQDPQETRVLFEFLGERVPLNQIDEGEDKLIVRFGETNLTDRFLLGKEEVSNSSEQSKEGKVGEEG